MTHFGVPDSDHKQIAAGVLNTAWFIFGRTFFLVYCGVWIMGPFWLRSLFFEVNSPEYKAFIIEMVAAIMFEISLNVAQSWHLIKKEVLLVYFPKQFDALSSGMSKVRQHVPLAEIGDSIKEYAKNAIDIEKIKGFAEIDVKTRIRSIALKAAMAELKKYDIDTDAVEAQITAKLIQHARVELAKRGVDIDNLET